MLIRSLRSLKSLRSLRTLKLLLLSSLLSSSVSLDINNTLKYSNQYKSLYATFYSWSTGSYCKDTFFPPGKVAETIGQFVRDNDETPEFGHSSEFASIASSIALEHVSESDVDKFLQQAKREASLNQNCLVEMEEDTIDEVVCNRLLIERMFRKIDKFDRDSVVNKSVRAHEFEHQMYVERQTLYEDAIDAMNSTSLDFFDNLGFDGQQWPVVEDASKQIKGLTKLEKTLFKEMMFTLFGMLLYRTDERLDTKAAYFCNEKVASYFGLFYFKDIKSTTVHNNTVIDVDKTRDTGEFTEFVLGFEQNAILKNMIDQQVSRFQDLYKAHKKYIEILFDPEKRSSSEYEQQMLEYARQKAEIDADIAINVFKAFKKTYNTLNDTQLDLFFEFGEESHRFECTDLLYFSTPMEHECYADKTKIDKDVVSFRLQCNRDYTSYIIQGAKETKVVFGKNEYVVKDVSVELDYSHPVIKIDDDVLLDFSDTLGFFTVQRNITFVVTMVTLTSARITVWSEQNYFNVRLEGNLWELGYEVVDLSLKNPVILEFDNLIPDTVYEFTNDVTLETRAFKTASKNTEVTFVAFGDPHYMDDGFDPNVFSSTLLDVIDSDPDFVVDLGDNFLYEKNEYKNLKEPCEFFTKMYSRLSCPVYMVNGNHDFSLEDPREQVKVVSKFFPYAVPNYYFFEWGDVLFIVLDAYFFNENKGGQVPYDEKGWHMTLGYEQYVWFESVVSQSSFEHKVVFMHSFLGGAFNDNSTNDVIDREFTGAGDSKYVHFFEQGGKCTDETECFASKRQGWGNDSLHELMVKNDVDYFIKGHDHLFYHDKVDGIVYMTVPRPSFNTNENTPVDNKGYSDIDEVYQGPGYVSFHKNASGLFFQLKKQDL